MLAGAIADILARTLPLVAFTFPIGWFIGSRPVNRLSPARYWLAFFVAWIVVGLAAPMSWESGYWRFLGAALICPIVATAMVNAMFGDRAPVRLHIAWVLSPWLAVLALLGVGTIIMRLPPPHLAARSSPPAALTQRVQHLPAASEVAAPAIEPGGLYARTTFQCGVGISYPAHWTVLSRESDLNYRAAVAASEGLADDSSRNTLLLLNSAPAPHGAQLRLKTEQAAGATQDQLIRIADQPDILQDVTAGLFRDLATGFESGQSDVQVVEMRQVRIERLANHAAVHISYDRRGLNGDSDWRVELYQVPIHERVLSLTLSYRVSEQAVWGPIAAASLASLTIGSGC